MPTIGIAGLDTPLAAELVERLTGRGADVAAAEPWPDELARRVAALTGAPPRPASEAEAWVALWPASPPPAATQALRVAPEGERPADIRVRDLLVIGEPGPWGPADLASLVEDDEASTPPRSWIPPRDVAHVIARLVLAGAPPALANPLLITGRRRWPASEVRAQLDLLTDRWRATQDGDARRLALPSDAALPTSQPGPAAPPPAVELGPLEAALRAADGDGFHSTTSLRATLMEWLVATGRLTSG